MALLGGINDGTVQTFNPTTTFVVREILASPNDSRQVTKKTFNTFESKSP